MKKVTIILLATFLSILSDAQTTYNTGNSEMDADLVRINADAKLDFGAFKTDLKLSFNVLDDKIDYLSVSVKMEPAEIYLTLELTKISGRSIDDVVEIYEVHKDKGWGYIAKELGIKPGSPEFHKLKEQTKNQGAKGKSKSDKGKSNK